MGEKTYEVYGYRWIVLLFFSLMQGVVQMLWITFAPITSEAAKFYGVSALQIGFLAMVYMIVYIIISIPASWTIDTFGIRKGVGFGVVLTAIFAFMRGYFGDSYTMVLISTIGIAIAQPFILNSITAMAARWFPLEERATAAGLSQVTLFIGIIVGMAVTPPLTIAYGISGMLYVYGIVTVVISVCYILFVKGAPPTPPAEVDTERVLVFDGLKHIFKQRDMVILIVIFFIGLGIFNAITTWVEQMIAPRGFSITQAGTLGAIMLGGGVVGCFIIPTLSDKFRRRKLFIIIGLCLTVPGLVGLTFVTDFALLLASGFILGFFFMSAGPVIYQYSAEVSYPAPEATSQGMLMLAGQISGIIFIFGMDMFRTETGSMTPFLIAMIVLATVNIVLALSLKESVIIEAAHEQDR